MEALEAQHGVDLAVPDTWLSLDQLPFATPEQQQAQPPRALATEQCEAHPRCKASCSGLLFMIDGNYYIYIRN